MREHADLSALTQAVRSPQTLRSQTSPPKQSSTTWSKLPAKPTSRAPIEQCAAGVEVACVDGNAALGRHSTLLNSSGGVDTCAPETGGQTEGAMSAQRYPKDLEVVAANRLAWVI